MSQNELKDLECCFSSRSAPWRAPHLAMIDTDVCVTTVVRHPCASYQLETPQFLKGFS